VEADRLLDELLELARSLGIDVRHVESCQERGGALVRLKGREVLFLDDSADSSERIEAVAGALAGRAELEGRFLMPEVRTAIEQASSKS
jgi:hypoxanthine phosphoribosyltransferase